MTRMIEEYVFEFGWKSVSDRLDYLRRELGISIETPAEELTALEEAYQVRHLLVHNGGRVSQEFLTRTQRTDVALGHLFTITADYAGVVSHQAVMVCKDVFIGVAQKFFGAVDADLFRIARGSNGMDPPLSSAAFMSQNGCGIFDNHSPRGGESHGTEDQRPRHRHREAGVSRRRHG